jgi:DNA invertase Pin-like site-specific DNA recombinase
MVDDDRQRIRTAQQEGIAIAKQQGKYRGRVRKDIIQLLLEKIKLFMNGLSNYFLKVRTS